MMGEPPVATGAVQETVEALSLKEVAVTAVGASGADSAGMAGFEAVEADPMPTAFRAVTAKV